MCFFLNKYPSLILSLLMGLVREGNILITYSLRLFNLDFGDGEGVRELS